MSNNILPEVYSIKIMGVSVTPLTIDQLNSIIVQHLEQINDQCIIAGHNLHSIYLTHHNSIMQDFFKEADYIRIDGMTLVLIGRLLGYPLKKNQRVTYVDWIMPLMKLAATKGWQVYYLGSAPGVAKNGAAILKSEYPDLNIATANGFFDPANGSEENKKTIETINKSQPDILMVGMGMPRQELWVLDNFDKIDARVILTCGACMDYIA